MSGGVDLLLDWPTREAYPERQGAVLELLRQALAGRRLTNGELVARLEQEIQDRTGAPFCVALASATAGLMLAVRAVTHDRPGCILLPVFAFNATALAPLWAGRRVVALPVDRGHLNLCHEAVAQALGTMTVAAVLAIGVAGNPSGLAALQSVTEQAGVPLIIDAAPCLGAVGAVGEASVISLSARKLLPAGEGGLVLLRSAETDASIRRLRQYGSTDGFFCTEQGLNARMSELHAAMALGCLPAVDATLQRRLAFAGGLREALAGLRGVTVQAVEPGVSPAWNDVVVRVTADRRADLVVSLRQLGVEAVPMYSPPLHRHPAFDGVITVDWQNRRQEMEALFSESLAIPVHSMLDGRHREALVDVFRDVLR